MLNSLHRLHPLTVKAGRAIIAAAVAPRGETFNYLDIGARGGINRRWRLLQKLKVIRPVLFEPDPDGAEALRRKSPECLIFETALGSVDGQKAYLNLTRDPALASILEPSRSLPPEVSATFEVIRKVPVTLSRLDTIFRDHGDPTFIKVDVQGYELEVLKGAGELLGRSIGVELETRVLRHYENLPTPTDLCEFMANAGFDLVKLSPNGYKGASISVFNAFFLRQGQHDSKPGRIFKTINDVGSRFRVNNWHY